ncbi:type II toxin-antitoxin system RelE/ParE family toxin [Desulforhabdus sp. TSK]|uniref:type II toxin-antitoxin system RelE/ParE family toxin n=1 Tax=Desulforhabdus sp. TSK TaxID=2925014 RepID=UPI0020832AFB|nr:toxin, RelE family protein [Desulforhabdus sp. TSK]
MRCEISIRPEAEAEIEEAYLWYEEQREGLGSDFLLCVEECLEKIKKSPDMYPIVHRNVRRLLIRRFPYGIFYTVHQDFITILAVFHGHRDPRDWKLRS